MSLFKMSAITEDILKQSLVNFYERTGKVPKTSDCRKSEGLFSYYQYAKRFGEFSTALEKAGLLCEVTDRRSIGKVSYSREELLQLLSEYAAQEDSLLSNEGILKMEGMPNPSIYIRRFGGLKKAFNMLGIDFTEHNKGVIKSKMVSELIMLAELLGRSPTCDDINEYSKMGICSSVTTFYSYFVDIYEAFHLAGISSTYSKKTKQELVDDLASLAERLGYAPSREELFFEEGMAGINTYYNVFGDWEKSLGAAGLVSRNVIRVTPLGTKCLSLYEYWFASMLEDINITYEKETYYKDVIPSYVGQMRFDYKVTLNSKTYYVEIFGMGGIRDYDATSTKKINLCSMNDVNLVTLYPKDFKNKSIENLRNRFFDRVAEIDKRSECVA